MLRSISKLAALAALFTPFHDAPPQDLPSWPMEFYAAEASVVMYQPQLEKLEGNLLSARAAVAVTPTGEEEPTFGAVWFDARLETDRAARTAAVLEIEVTDAKFPEVESDPVKMKQLSALLTDQVKLTEPVLSLDQLVAALDLEQENADAALNDDPPAIIFKTHPALLVLLDGPAKLAEIEDSPVMQVVNSPYLIFFETQRVRWYMTDGKAWLTAGDVKGPWKTEPTPPTSVLLVMSIQGAGRAETDFEGDNQPEIVVATEPTELISIDGEPQYTPIGSTGLLHVANTESDVFRDIETQQTFVLISGRWYATKSTTDGPWTHVPPDQLPAGFAAIDPDSEQAGVLASVAGTQQALEAVQETDVPQTAAIDRGTTIQVEYDGEPEFANIEGTWMAYAENASYSVIRVRDGAYAYYCCNEAVWFSASSPYGPWVLCTSVPDVIYTIPSSCPVYNVTYVYVYDSTPTVVYVGYYPGYVGCYSRHGVIVYGTGWRYRPWYRHRYYARPCTWGFAVRYNPWTGGWGVRVGYRGRHGGIAVATRGGWWAGGRRRRGSADISRSVTTPRGTWESETSIERKRGQTEIDRDVSFTPNENIYDRKENRDRRGGEGRKDRKEPGQRPAQQPTRRPETAPRKQTSPGEARTRESRERPNNVYADRNGNVQRRTDNGWQSRNKGGGWSERQSQPRSRDVERSRQSRQRSTQRSNSYQNRSSGRSRSGGGGRRR